MPIPDFIHPSDRAALEAFKALPGVDFVMKKFFELCSEKQYRAQCLATKVRLSPTQLPAIYNKLPPICERLNIAVPEMYLEANVHPNASAFGEANPIICVTSGLITSMQDEEIESVLAHECGHIACHHMMYHSLAYALIWFADAFDILGLTLKPIIWALLKWQRCSELSADRAAAYALNSFQRVINTQLRLAGGPFEVTKDVDIDEFIKQADEFDSYEPGVLKGIVKNMLALNQTHPFAAVRVREIKKWGHSLQYREMIKNIPAHLRVGTTCPNCGQEINPQWAFCKFCGNKLS